MMRQVSVSDHVVFADAPGDPVVAVVEEVWWTANQDFVVPVVNLRVWKTGVLHNSVPHKYSVPTARSFYWE